MSVFAYPAMTHVRKHGPRGYETYGSYRPWLRDEFLFRCVYCLRRERWGVVTGEFSIDHFLPVARYPGRALDYDNLLYACVSCNGKKRANRLPDPTIVLTAEAVSVREDGSIVGHTTDARRLISELDLDSDEMTYFRQVYSALVSLAEVHKPGLHARLMAYPDDLPNLAALRPPGGNTRPDGIAQSHHARRARGELPATY
jgi:hypothetical protein